MQRLQAIGLSLGLISAGMGFSRLVKAQGTSAATSTAPAAGTSAVDTARGAALLGRMHRAAQREVQLGEAAEGGGRLPECGCMAPS